MFYFAFVLTVALLVLGWGYGARRLRDLRELLKREVGEAVGSDDLDKRHKRDLTCLTWTEHCLYAIVLAAYVVAALTLQVSGAEVEVIKAVNAFLPFVHTVVMHWYDSVIERRYAAVLISAAQGNAVACYSDYLSFQRQKYSIAVAV